MCQDFIPFYGRISYLLSFNYHQLPLRKTVLSPLNYKKVFFPSPSPFPLRMITNTWNWHINLSWASLKNIMFMLNPFKVAICFRSAYFQGVFCFFKALLNYTLTSFKCTMQWLYRVMQPLPQSSFRTFLSPQKALSILTSSLRQPVIYYFFHFWNMKQDAFIIPGSLGQKPRNGGTGVSALGLTRLKSGCQLSPGGSGEESSFQLISVVDGIHFLAAVGGGPRPLAGCQQGPLSVSKRLPHSSIPSLWSSICKASNSACSLESLIFSFPPARETPQF